MASTQGTSGGGMMTRKRTKIQKKEENAKKVKRNTRTSYIVVDQSTGKIKTEVKQEPLDEEEEEREIIVKEEVDVPMENEEVLEGVPVESDSENLVDTLVKLEVESAATAESVVMEGMAEAVEKPVQEHTGTSGIKMDLRGQSVEEVPENGSNSMKNVHETTGESDAGDDKLRRITEENMALKKLADERGARIKHLEQLLNLEETSVKSNSSGGGVEGEVASVCLEDDANLHSKCVPQEVFQRTVRLLQKADSDNKEEAEQRFRTLEATIQELKKKLCNSSAVQQTNEHQAQVGEVLEPEVATEMSQESTETLQARRSSPLINLEASTGACQEESLRIQEREQSEVDKVVTLFPQVVEVLWRKYGYSMINKSDYLNTRLVCSSMKNGIDEIKQVPWESIQGQLEQNCFWIKVDEGIIWRSQNGIATEFKFNLYESIIKIRSLLKIEDSTEVCKKKRNESLNIIAKFVRRYGHWVRGLVYSSRNSCGSRGNFGYSAETFLGWIRCMPNLERISLDGRDLNYKSYKHVTHFPTLSKMTHFCHSSDWAYWPAKMFKAALIANSQLTSLNLWMFGLDLSGISLPQLKTLSILWNRGQSLPKKKVCILYGRDPPNNLYGTLQRLNAPRLEKISIADRLDADEYPKLRLAFRKFRASLQTLELNLSLDWNDDIEPLPEMLGLKKLVLKTYNSYLWSATRVLEFVSKCVFLEHLVLQTCGNWQWCDCHGKCNFRREQLTLLDRKVDLRKHMRTEFVSKLWNGLPNLRQVEVARIAFLGGMDNPFEFVFIRSINDDPILET